MEILTREELKELKEYLDKTHGEKAVTNMQDVTNTALVLFDKVDKLEGRIIEAHDEGVEAGMKAVMGKVEKLRQKWEKELQKMKAYEGYGYDENIITLTDCISDISTLCGKEEK